MLLVKSNVYDLGIIGGGLAGLSLASLLAGKGISVLVLEKEMFPRHKVCGEYVSNESLDFLNRLGFPFHNWELPGINRFELTFPKGKAHSCTLNPGGFGISRYTMDAALADLARRSKAIVEEGVKVTRWIYRQGLYLVDTTDGQQFCCRRLVVAAGRNRGGVLKKNRTKKKTKGWFGVKYHIDKDFPDDLIQINVFPGGYAGISKVEGGKLCFCYLAQASGLKKVGGSIKQFENSVLSANPTLSGYVSQMQILEGPFTTGNFSFEYCDTSTDSVIFIGDSAAFIPPLTGNGMSLAFRSASVAGELISGYFEGGISWEEVETSYRKYGEKYLRRRIQSGKFLQNLALHPSLFVQSALSAGLTLFPPLLGKLSKKAVGKSF